MFGKTAKTGKLIVTGIACAVDPTGITIAAATLDGAIHASDEWLKSRPDLAKLAAELDADFEHEIKKPRYDKPDEIRLHLPMMLAASFPDAETISKEGLDANLIFNSMKERLTDKEHRRPENVAAFRDAFLPLLRKACDDPRLISAIGGALTRQDSQWKRGTDAKLDEIVDKIQGNENLTRLARELARQEKLIFEIAGKFLQTHPDDPLEVLQEIERALLSYAANAEQKSNLGSEFTAVIAHIDDLLLNQGDIAAAKAAVVQAKEEAALKAQEMQAQQASLLDKQLMLAKLENDAAAAADIEVEKLALEQSSIVPVKQMIGLAVEKEDQYNRFGSTFDCTTAIALLEKALNIARPQDYPDIIIGQIANAWQSLGIRQSSPEILAKAVFWYREHEKQVPKSLLRTAWAMTQNNLAGALQSQGTRTDGAEGADLLAQAVTAYRAALEVRTRKDHPVQWATTQNNLANALQNQGTRTDGAKGADLLAQAVTAYRAALEVNTRKDHPVKWAGTQNNLAAALRNQGTRTDGAAGADLLAQAVTTYRAALEVHTREDHPVHWAETQENIAIAQKTIATHDSCTDPAAALALALAAVDAALTVYDPVHLSYDHGTATRLRGDILADFDALD